MPRSDFNSLALGTRLASGLGRGRQKYVFVPYRELAYVSFEKMLNKPNTWLNFKEKHLNRAKMHCNGLREPVNDVSNRLVVNLSNSKVTASSSDLLFNKGLTNTYLSGRGHAPHSWALQLASLKQKRWVRLTSSL